MIYCVEDDDNIRELVIYTLETTGLKATGLRGRLLLLWRLWRSIRQSLFCLTLCSREKTGLHCLRKLKSSSQKTKDIPVIMVTAKGRGVR